jgi:hypothetical protein
MSFTGAFVLGEIGRPSSGIRRRSPEDDGFLDRDAPGDIGAARQLKIRYCYSSVARDGADRLPTPCPLGPGRRKGRLRGRLDNALTDRSRAGPSSRPAAGALTIRNSMAMGLALQEASMASHEAGPGAARSIHTQSGCGPPSRSQPGEINALMGRRSLRGISAGRPGWGRRGAGVVGGSFDGEGGGTGTSGAQGLGRFGGEYHGCECHADGRRGNRRWDGASGTGAAAGGIDAATASERRRWRAPRQRGRFGEPLQGPVLEGGAAARTTWRRLREGAAMAGAAATGLPGGRCWDRCLGTGAAARH